MTELGSRLVCQILLIGALTALAFPLQSVNAERGRVVLLVVDKLAFEDLAEFPKAMDPVRALTDAAGIGIMNVRTAAGTDSGGGYLSLGMGRRVEGGVWSGYTLAPDELFQSRPASEVYHSLTGRAGNAEALHLGIGELQRRLEAGKTAPGALGNALQDAGRSVALLGSGDVPGERLRYGGLIAMNHLGTVQTARLDDGLVVVDAEWPTGWRTDYEELFTALVSALRENELTVVDIADLARLESVASYLDPDRGLEVRERALTEIFSFVARVVTWSRENQSVPTGVYVISPSPPRAFGRQGVLTTPILRWHNQEASGGLLSSPSTRRAGLVTNSDLLPSALQELGVEPHHHASGRPWRVSPHPDPLATTLDRYFAIREVHLQRLPVIQPYFFLMIGFVASGALLTFLVHRGILAWSARTHAWWKAALTALASYPAALLLLALFEPAPLPITWLRLGLAVAAITTVATYLGRGHSWGGVGLVAVGTAALIGADILMGAPMMQGSLLGYDPIAGSRYYGIGNEYMGTLIGAALIGTGYLLDRRLTGPADGGSALLQSGAMDRLPLFALLAITVILAHPNLGINVGGALTAASAVVALHFLARDRPITLRQALFWSGVIALSMVAVAVMDFVLFQREASHLGRAVAMVADSGTDPLWDIFSRKVSVNMRLIRLTIWSRVVIASIALLGVLYLWPNWLSRTLWERHRWLVRVTRAALASACVALVVNDSGVVAASTLLLWPVLVSLTLAVPIAGSGAEMALDSEGRT